MRHAIVFCIIIGLSVLSGCSKAQEQSNRNENLSTGKNVLIVYLSRTSNTKAIAQIIHKNAGGTMAALELETPYPENYQATVQQVADENATGFLPPLKTKIDSIEKYDVVFIGFPTWGMQLPPPMKSFLHQYDLSGKKVIPFNTNGGYGIGSSFQTVKELCPNSEVLDGFTVKGGSERDGILLAITGDKEKKAETEVIKWLRKIKILQ
ncbi:MAG: flavodoxin [Sphingobacteriales bacterium]|nr:flavodoxin [Sphingobacteriales bacterium]